MPPELSGRPKRAECNSEPLSLWGFFDAAGDFLNCVSEFASGFSIPMRHESILSIRDLNLFSRPCRRLQSILFLSFQSRLLLEMASAELEPWQSERVSIQRWRPGHALSKSSIVDVSISNPFDKIQKSIADIFTRSANQGDCRK
jgi:hypothetical protein